MNKIVSVIVPVYNRAGFILKTLDNLKESNYRPLELLLVDDGSSDDSLRILNEFKTQNSDSLFDVKVFTQKNQGAPIARNFGFSKSKGDFIQFLDSDDLIAPDKFSSQVSLMNTTGSDFCLSDFELINLGVIPFIIPMQKSSERWSELMVLLAVVLL